MHDPLFSRPVHDMTRRETVRVRPETPIGVLVRALRDARRGGALVLDAEDALVGVITECDVLRAVATGDRSMPDGTVSDLMTREPTVAGPHVTIGQALRMLESGDFRHLPLVDADGHALALISIRDLLRDLVERFPEAFLNLPPAPDREARGPWGG